MGKDAMTQQEKKIFPEVKGFINYLAACCKGCFYQDTSQCIHCPANSAKILLKKMEETEFENFRTTADSRKQEIIDILKKRSPEKVLASEMKLSDQCSKHVRSMTLAKMVADGEIVRHHVSGTLPRYSLPEKK